MHDLILHNDQVCDSSSTLLTPGQVGFLNGWGVFSTLRVYDSIMFEWDKHYARMKHDSERVLVPMPEKDVLESQLYKLIEANEAIEATLRVAVVRNKGGMFEGPGLERDFDVIAFTREVNPWGESVRLDVAPNARFSANEFVNLKVTAWSHNLTIYERAHQKGFDEAVLMNERHEVSECTSANIFAVFGKRVLTPPLATSGCLPGITRDVLLNELTVEGYEIQEHILFLADLAGANEVFLTSTTRETLPVSYIDGIGTKFLGDVRKRIQEKYTEYTKNYTARKKAERAALLAGTR